MKEEIVKQVELVLNEPSDNLSQEKLKEFEDAIVMYNKLIEAGLTKKKDSILMPFDKKHKSPLRIPIPR